MANEYKPMNNIIYQGKINQNYNAKPIHIHEDG